MEVIVAYFDFTHYTFENSWLSVLGSILYNYFDVHYIKDVKFKVNNTELV